MRPGILGEMVKTPFTATFSKVVSKAQRAASSKSIVTDSCCKTTPKSVAYW